MGVTSFNLFITMAQVINLTAEIFDAIKKESGNNDAFFKWNKSVGYAPLNKTIEVEVIAVSEDPKQPFERPIRATTRKGKKQYFIVLSNPEQGKKGQSILIPIQQKTAMKEGNMSFDLYFYVESGDADGKERKYTPPGKDADGNKRKEMTLPLNKISLRAVLAGQDYLPDRFKF